MKYRICGEYKMVVRFELDLEANDPEDAEIRLESWSADDIDDANTRKGASSLEDGDMEIDVDEVKEVEEE